MRSDRRVELQPRLSSRSDHVSLCRILCETVKDFVAKVGKAYEKSVENVEECDTMSLKVGVMVGGAAGGVALTAASESAPLPRSAPSSTRSWTPSCRRSTPRARPHLPFPAARLPSWRRSRRRRSPAWRA